MKIIVIVVLILPYTVHKSSATATLLPITKNDKKYNSVDNPHGCYRGHSQYSYTEQHHTPIHMLVTPHVLMLSLSRSDILLLHIHNLFQMDDFSKQTKKKRKEERKKGRKKERKKERKNE